MSVRLLGAKDLDSVCSMADAIDAVGAGFVALSAGRATVPVRLSVPINKEGLALTMPASLTGASCYSVKVVSVTPANAIAGRPLVTATVLLIDASSGDLLALIDGTALTALRTGAAGGVAARALARSGASRAALFGAGAQARAQLLALVAVHPIREVRLATRDQAHARAFQSWATGEPSLAGLVIEPASAAAAVAGADIVVTATTSATPVFPGAALPAGVHVTAVGAFTPEMRELDDATLRGARVVVDQRAAALAEAGELRGARPEDVVEIGEVLAGVAPGRETTDQRTVFKSVGNAIQDLVVATRAFERARVLGIGEVIEFP
jgi:ornithine cyclodeaminase/alanine dehydrogenase-like protein (mu-crystallin family)